MQVSLATLPIQMRSQKGGCYVDNRKAPVRKEATEFHPGVLGCGLAGKLGSLDFGSRRPEEAFGRLRGADLHAYERLARRRSGLLQKAWSRCHLCFYSHRILHVSGVNRS